MEITPSPTPVAMVPRWFETRRGAWQLCGVALALWFGLGQLAPGFVIGVWVALRSGGKVSPAEIEAQVIPFLGVILAASAIVALLIAVTLRAAGWLVPPPAGASRAWVRWAWLLGSVVACLGGQFLLTGVRHLADLEPGEADPVLLAALQGSTSFFVLALAVTPIGEELLFRRVLLSTLSRGQSRAVAWVVTTILFAAVHVNLDYVPNYLWMSIWFTVAYEQTGSVWGAILVHSLNNVIAFATAMV